MKLSLCSTVRRSTLGCLGFAAVLYTALPAQELVAIKAGRVITITSGELENAVILIENGKIKALGQNLEVPWNAKVIDATAGVVMPTYVIAHTAGGMSSGNERMQNVPFLTVQDAVDPSSKYFEEALRNGVGCVHVIPGHSTLIGGAGMIVRPYGKTVEDMAVRTKSALKLSLGSGSGSRMAQIRKLRRALQDAVEYQQDFDRRKQEFEKEKAAGATDKQEFDAKPDEKKKPVLDLLAGKVGCHLYVPSAAEVAEVGRMVEKYEIEPVLVLGTRFEKAIDALAQLGLPIVLDANSIEYKEKDPETDEERTINQAKLLAARDIAFAMVTDTRDSGPRRYPWWQMATAIRGGVDRETALRSMTIESAKILGLADELGSIEPGKVANLQLLTGDPLAATTWVDQVLLEGEVVYERGRDHRLRRLFGEADKQADDGNDQDR